MLLAGVSMYSWLDPGRALSLEEEGGGEEGFQQITSTGITLCDS
jgi:hypothetical protein